ncbi:vitamin K epoxide reductase family protein [Amycolatopsis sp. NPDC089917]|uniref:vitamin K epoxide reductase family protein n=1 Tax=Amycolatopsis sp. NPDC089917 TaxID=3155187 RepID=UPI00343171C6
MTEERAPFAVRVTPWVLLIGGAIGLVAALVLTVEKIKLLKDFSYIPTCSINPVLSCGSIMKTPQAELFGFPNPLLGIVGFTVVLTTGVAVLSGARLPRWYWLGLQTGSALGVLFVHWLMLQSLYVIGALCPYCMVVWAVTIAVFWYTTLRNLHSGRTVLRYHSVVLVVWYAVIAAAVLQAFWSYWKTLV